MFLVYVPDMDIYTEGNNLTDAIDMARDAIGLMGVSYEDDGKLLPVASSYEEALKKAKSNAEIFDYSKGLLTLVDADLTDFRARHNNRTVKKNCTIPYYLNTEAEKRGINFSRVLQEALIEKSDNKA